MRLLYLSCHAILEYDELKLFEELGIDYFSLGSYIVPTQPVDPIRPALQKTVDETLLHMEHDRDKLSKEFVSQFDTIIVMHKPEWIRDNWDILKEKRVIWRSIGQSSPHVEEILKPYRQEGLEVVRYSQQENNIEGNIGSDIIIHFYKDPQEFGNYNGINKEAITFAQNMIDRGEHCHFDLFKEITNGIPAKIFGPKNENAGEYNGGFLTYTEMRQKMRDSRVYIYTGTQPASYTLNFVEALMTGIPIVAIGSKWGNSLEIAGKDVYAIPYILNHGVNGYFNDNIGQLHDTVQMLLEDPTKCKLIGGMGRELALEYFSKDVIKSRWKEYLGV